MGSKRRSYLVVKRENGRLIPYKLFLINIQDNARIHIKHAGFVAGCHVPRGPLNKIWQSPGKDLFVCVCGYHTGDPVSSIWLTVCDNIDYYTENLKLHANVSTVEYFPIEKVKAITLDCRTGKIV